MFNKQQIARIKAVCFCAALIPLARLVWLGISNELGANPIEFVIRSNGTWALTMLLITLTMTPIRILTGATWPIQLRGMMGLFTFFYACLHIMSYVWLDQWFDWQAISHDIVKHPFIIAGFSAFVLLIPLAVTSNKASMRKMGRNWQKLHKLVYAIAILACLHYWWLVKKDIRQPAIYAVVLLILLGIRFYARQFPAAARARPQAVSQLQQRQAEV